MSELLVVPLKKSSEVDVEKPLKNLIYSLYNLAAVDHSESISEFAKLRNSAISKASGISDSSLDILCSYYDQLCALETKVSGNELQIPFKWNDAFDKRWIFGGRISLTLTSLAYEKECVLFNIAAFQSALAASQDTDSIDDLNLALKLLQKSAGIFAHLEGVTPLSIPQERTLDLNPDTLQALSNLMLAQAQEIFIVKAIKCNIGEVSIAKLASQCEDLYAKTMHGMQKDSICSLWNKKWITMVAGKRIGFKAITQLYQSMDCKANQSISVKIARLISAIELFKVAQSRSGRPKLFEDYASHSRRQLTEALKYKNVVSNGLILAVETPGKVQLAKALPLNLPLSPNPKKDLFADLVPAALQQAISASVARKNELVEAEILRLHEASQAINDVLANLNLPATIDVISTGVLPQSLLDKGREVREKGGIASIRTLIDEMPELLQRNQDILDESDRMLNEEREADARLRTQFKERWTRMPSEMEMYRPNAGKYREIIRNAIDADKMVRETFNNQAGGIEVLENIGPSLQELRRLMEIVDTIKVEREIIESELKSLTIDLKEQFLSALAKDGAIDEPNIWVGSIEKVFAPLREEVTESITRQEALMNDIQAAHQAFVAENIRGSSSGELSLSDLACAYDHFTKLQNNLKEGRKFYNDFTQMLVTFKAKVSDFCTARETEEQALMRMLAA